MRKPINRCLQCDKQHFAVVQRLARIGSWELDLTTHVLNWSDEVFRLFEIDPSRFGASYDAFLALIHPEDREAVHRAYTASVESRTPYTVEHRLLFANGRIKYVLEHGETFYGEDGNPLRTIGTVQDITERKLTEIAQTNSTETLRAIIHATPLAIVDLDLEGNVRSIWNPAAERMFGWRADEVIGRPLPTVDADKEGEFLHHREMIRNGLTLNGVEVRRKRRDGSPIDYAIYATPLCDRNGAITGNIGVMADVSERKAAELQLRQSHDLLRALVKHQFDEHESMRHAIAHKIHEDVAQSIAAANVYLESIKGDPRHAEVVAAVTHINEHITYQLRKMVDKLRPNVLNMGIGAALDWLASDFQRGIGLRFILDIRGHAEIDDDMTTFLFRAAQELLINIALHAAASEVRLSFDTDKSHCRLAIRDNGCGFALEAPCKPDAFGLIRLNEQASNFGGQFVIDTAPGRGTCVEIVLPLPSCQH